MPRTVGLFITCLTDQFYPRVGVAVVKVLEKLGWHVEFPAAQTCCGQPFFNNGLHDEAKALAARFVEIFAPYEYIVTPSASCCAMVREHFAQLLHHPLRERTFEFVEFLEKVAKFDPSTLKLPQATSCTYHYSCHQRLIGMTNQAEQMLRSIGNVNFKSLDKSDQCCGFGGTFSLKFPQISEAMSRDKAACIDKTDAQVLVCNDAGCAMTIQTSLRTKHIAELIAEAMGLSLETL